VEEGDEEEGGMDHSLSLYIYLREKRVLEARKVERRRAVAL